MKSTKTVILESYSLDAKALIRMDLVRLEDIKSATIFTNKPLELIVYFKNSTLNLQGAVYR